MLGSRTGNGKPGEIVLDSILAEVVLDKGSLSIGAEPGPAKYQYLDKSDRAFITRGDRGEPEYLLQIDYIINKYSKTGRQDETAYPRPSCG